MIQISQCGGSSWLWVISHIQTATSKFIEATSYHMKDILCHTHSPLYCEFPWQKCPLCTKALSHSNTHAWNHERKPCLTGWCKKTADPELDTVTMPAWIDELTKGYRRPVSNFWLQLSNKTFWSPLVFCTNHCACTTSPYTTRGPEMAQDILRVRVAQYQSVQTLDCHICKYGSWTTVSQLCTLAPHSGVSFSYSSENLQRRSLLRLCLTPPLRPAALCPCAY